MPDSLWTFLSWLPDNPALTASVLLTLGVLLVNGWTDAPNAIAGAVVTGAMPFPLAAALAAVCNFGGALCVTAVNTAVAQTTFAVADFGNDPRLAGIALCAAMAAVVVWATAAWRMGIPTSESHALVAGVSGAAIALNGVTSLQPEAWAKIIMGLVLSTAAGFALGRLVMAMAVKLPERDGLYRLAQVPAAAVTAFLHGAQDGQKFMGIFALGIVLSRGGGGEQTFSAPMWLIMLCALTIALGTALGGRRIIDKVGRDMVELTPRRGFAADVAGGLCLAAATALGLPVSTTHTRTTALLGVTVQEDGQRDRKVFGSIALAWLLTFPGCGAIGFLITKLWVSVFFF